MSNTSAVALIALEEELFHYCPVHDDRNVPNLRVRKTSEANGRGLLCGIVANRLTTSAVTALRTHLSRQLEEMQRMGSLYQPGRLIFATETGKIINPSNLRNRYFQPLLKRVGLRPSRFHDLRHTCATLLLSQDANPEIVSEMLGHSSISVTLDIYSHLLPDMQEKAAKALEEALG